LASPDFSEFAERLTGLANIYPRPTTKQLMLPAIVLRPDEPWIEPGGYGWDDENFMAVCVAGTGDTDAATTTLRSLAAKVMEVITDDYEFKDVSEPFVDSRTGTPLLAMRVRIRARRIWSELSSS
jgi:hypothetical protein